MKKILIAALAAISFAACAPNKTEAPVKKGNGYTDIETPNVKLVQQLNEVSMKYDTAATRGLYSSNLDTIHNNNEDMTVDQNMRLLASMQKDGITATIDNYYAIWETVNDKPNEKGVTNFVLAYMKMTITRGTKSAKVFFHQVCAIKDGKVVEEWDVYDSKPFNDIMQ
jgi:hypothetical protein